MASKLAQFLTTARALPPTPFRASGPQLTDAIEGMASRAFNMPAKSDVRDVEAKTLSAYEEERVERAIVALGRLREGEALREVSTAWAVRRRKDEEGMADERRRRKDSAGSLESCCWNVGGRGEVPGERWPMAFCSMPTMAW